MCQLLFYFANLEKHGCPSVFLCQTHKHTPTVSFGYLFKSEVVLTCFDQLKSAICNIRGPELKDSSKI